MLGSSLSIACPNHILNTIVAESLCEFADELERADDFTDALNQLIRKTIKEHKRIIFNGNNYSEEWVAEAEKRGLLNLHSTPEALPYYISEKNVALFEKFGVLSKTEIHARYEIQLENYCKQLHIEALTMIDMIKKEILPAVCSYMKDISKEALNKKQLNAEICCELEETLLKKLSALSAELYRKMEVLEKAITEQPAFGDLLEEAKYYRNTVFASMEDTRTTADEIESLVGEKYWPYPTYGKLLFSVV